MGDPLLVAALACPRLVARSVPIKINFDVLNNLVRDKDAYPSAWKGGDGAMTAKGDGPLMSIVHLLIIVVPSFAAGLIFGRSLLTGAYWGIGAEAIGLLMVALPISSGGSRNGLSLTMIGVSLVLGALAGALGFGARRLVKSQR